MVSQFFVFKNINISQKTVWNMFMFLKMTDVEFSFPVTIDSFFDSLQIS